MLEALDETGFTWLFNAVPDATLVTDESGTIVAANPRAAALFGWTREALHGMKVEALMPERFRAHHPEKHAQYCATPSTREMGAGRSFVALRHDGTEFPAEISLSPLRDDLPNMVLVAIRDVSERRSAEQRLFRERERAMVTLTSIADAVITTDPAGVVDYLNPAAERLTGRSMAAALGQPLDRVLPLVSDLSGNPVESPIVLYLRRGPGGPEEQVSLRLQGRLLPIAYNVAPLSDSEGKFNGVVVVFRDVVEQRGLARRLAHEATHDSLTGLVNRGEFERRLLRALDPSRAGRPATLCYMDLDRFKGVNDRWGHMAGDDALRQAAAVVGAQVRQRDTLARLGGDEFAALLENCSLDEGIRLARKVQQAVRDHRFAWRDETFHLGISVGVVALDPESDPASLLLAADGACYASKDRGGVTVEVARLGKSFARRG